MAAQKKVTITCPYEDNDFELLKEMFEDFQTFLEDSSYSLIENDLRAYEDYGVLSEILVSPPSKEESMNFQDAHTDADNDFKIESMKFCHSYRLSSRDIHNLIIKFSCPLSDEMSFNSLVNFIESYNNEQIKFKYEFESNDKNIRTIFNHDKESYDIHYSSTNIMKVVNSQLSEKTWRHVVDTVREEYSKSDKKVHDYDDALYEINRDMSSVSEDLMSRLTKSEEKHYSIRDVRNTVRLIEKFTYQIEKIIIDNIESYLTEKTVFRYSTLFISFLIHLKTPNKELKNVA